MTDAVRRIAASEFGALRECLADRTLPSERKVHEARKATKRLRSLLRLVAPVCPEARAEIETLREAAARLSALRDRSALSEALARLSLPEATHTVVSDVLAPHPVSKAVQKKLLAGFAAEMEMAAARADGWSLSKDGWAALSAGLRRSHHRFCKTLQAARNAADEEPVHEFRKRAKDHWHHTLLLRGAFPAVMEGYAAAAEDLCDALGDWRDLGLLEAALRGLPADTLPKAKAAAALDLIARSRRRALKRAFRIARRLAAESPEDYAARLKSWWKISH